MAISSSYTWAPTRDEILKTAFRLIGEIAFGVEPSANQVLGATDMLQSILKALQNSGVLLHTIERDTNTTTSGTASYTADADTLDVLFPAYVTPSSGSGTSQLTQMQRDEYMTISDKTTTGVPTRMFIEKASTQYLTMILYPVPDASTTSFTYHRVRLLRDADSGTVTMDLPSKWMKYLQYALAHELALHYNRALSKVQYLAAMAEKERDEAQGNEHAGGDITFVPARRWSV